MSKKKIGAYVDEEVWEEFGKWVKEKHGGRTQNVKGLELEKALESHMEEDAISQIDRRLDELDQKGDSIEEQVEEINERLDALLTLVGD